MGQNNDVSGTTAAATTRINSNKMGLFGAVSYIIGNIVGAGLFITPTSVLEQVDTVNYFETGNIKRQGCEKCLTDLLLCAQEANSNLLRISILSAWHRLRW